MEPDDRGALRWEVAATAAWSLGGPADPGAAELEWLPAEVPGTAAGALRAAGRWSLGDERDFDAEDWWFRTTFVVDDDHDGEEHVLRLEGVATLAEVWLDGEPVLSPGNMFAADEFETGPLAGQHELLILCRGLRPFLAQKKPRPRWKTRLVPDQSLRWIRTTFLGRMSGFGPVPAPVGPWRPVTIEPASPRLVGPDLRCWVESGAGVVKVTARVVGPVRAVQLHVGKAAVDLDVTGAEVKGELRIDDVDLWWPHTHGRQPLYDCWLAIDGRRQSLGRVGFRTIGADARDVGLQINGTDVFCRGACWVPLDPVTLTSDPDDLRRAITDVRDAGMNMVRLTGTMVYEDAAFWDLCDEFGIMVWQDAMFANIDPPDDEAFLASVERELATVFPGLQGRPSVTVICGGSEIEQQAAMMGRPPLEPIALLDQTVPAAVERWLPDVPFVRSTPTGGDLPFHVDEGFGHYYGVGAYLRPLEDARRANVRFTPECLAFAVPPDRETVAATFAPDAIGGDRWEAAVPRDRGTDWGFEDVTDHYVAEFHGIDARQLRKTDPERALDLARATVAHIVESTFAEWRRQGSSCRGALIFTLRDLVAGAGWGLLDAQGRPKASWYAAARAMQPVALLVTDEGVNGLHLHLVNDTANDIEGTLAVTSCSAEGHTTESGSAPVVVPARGHHTMSAEAILGGFRDITYAYRFGPPAIDSVGVEFRGADLVRQAVFLPGGQRRPQEPLGLEAKASASGDSWDIDVRTERLAQWVAFDVPGRRISDSWFNLAGGSSHRVRVEGSAEPRGTVRALNGVDPVAVTIGR